MKKFLPLFFSLFLLAAACTKPELATRPPIDESYWLAKDRGIVTNSDYTCDFFIIETYTGYTLLRSWEGIPPMNGSVVYGDFNRFGLITFYNRTDGYLMKADIREYYLTYWDASDLMNWNCSRP